MLEDTLEAIWHLTKAGFMINLKKSHLVEDSAKVLRHFWLTGGFWVPNIEKLHALVTKTNKELGRMSPPLLYGLLNFYQEYILHLPSWWSPSDACYSRMRARGRNRPRSRCVRWLGKFSSPPSG